ncbi:MAG: rhodanese-like domain-containing protein [Betaproteobacteria bacterium]|nr:rhodanese-like domain-containing protein [Betaproteobacteria bacterium]
MEFVQQNLMWIALALISGGMLVWPMLRGGMGGASVSPLQATLMINREDAIVLDVRESEEFARGHVPNSRHFPVGQIDKRVSELQKFKTRPLIVVCHSGNRSGAACGALRKHGFEKVFNLAGGMGAWEQAGQPVTRKS